MILSANRELFPLPSTSKPPGRLHCTPLKRPPSNSPCSILFPHDPNLSPLCGTVQTLFLSTNVLSFFAESHPADRQVSKQFLLSAFYRRFRFEPDDKSDRSTHASTNTQKLQTIRKAYDNIQTQSHTINHVLNVTTYRLFQNYDFAELNKTANIPLRSFESPRETSSLRHGV